MRSQEIWVIYGGESSEREVSLKTGANLLGALQSKGFKAKGVEIKTHKDLLGLFQSHKPNLVLLGLHGTFGEDGRVQGFLETVGVPYVGSGVLSSALCFNKAVTQSLLKQSGCPVASFVVCEKRNFSLPKFLKENPKILNKKSFIKAACQGSTIGVYRYDPQEFSEDQREVAFHALCEKAFGYDDELIVEEWIEGRELTCAVVMEEAYPLVEIRPNSKFYDYTSKYTAGETEYLCPAPLDENLSKKIQAACLKAFKVLRCQDYARIDVMLNNSGEFFILEANTLPGMTSTSLVPKAARAKGLSFEDFVEFLVLQSLARQKGIKIK
jgi:D-alanine-D-alanine ligase